MNTRKVLVLGGKGKTGRKVAERLSQQGHTVRIGSRTASPPFDWENPKTWESAVNGMDSVYITYQPDLAVPGAKETIQAFTEVAVKNGIQDLVILSGRGEQEAQECENVVMNAGVNWAVVRADWFNQNFSENFFLDPILAGEVTLPRAEAKIPFIDTDDIADVVVAVLLNQQLQNQVHELTGPRMLTFKDVVEEVNKATGREIKFTPISLEEYVQIMKEHKVPEPMIWLVRYLFTQTLDGRNSSITDGVEKVLGRKPKDFSEYARETADLGIWNIVIEEH